MIERGGILRKNYVVYVKKKLTRAPAGVKKIGP